MLVATLTVSAGSPLYRVSAMSGDKVITSVTVSLEGRDQAVKDMSEKPGATSVMIESVQPII